MTLVDEYDIIQTMNKIMKNLIFTFIIASFFSLGVNLASASPSVSTITATSNGTSITLKGMFSGSGSQVTTKFEYSTKKSDLPTNQAGVGNMVCQKLQPINNQTGTFSCTLSTPTITAGTIYYFRAIASDISGTNYGDVFFIQTTNSNNIINNCLVPTISSISPNSITANSNSATITITGTNFIDGTSQDSIYPNTSSKGLFNNLNKTTNVLNSNSLTITLNSGDLSTAGTFNIKISNGNNCNSNSLIFTVTANNGGGGGGGGGGSGGGGGGGGGSSGSYSYPIVNTLTATNISTNSVILNATVNPKNKTTKAWFEYGNISNLISYNQTPQINQGSGNSALNFSQNITNLNPNTTYYFRIVAQNSSGIRRGSILSFKTNYFSAPVVINTSPVIYSNTINTPAKLNQKTEITKEKEPEQVVNDFENYKNNNLSAASIFGFSFLPNSLIGWLVLILLILCFLIVLRAIYATYPIKKEKIKYSDEEEEKFINNLPR